MTSNLQKNWWLLSVRGLFAILFGLLALFLPGLVLETLILFFGILMIVSGGFFIIDGISNKENRAIRIIEGVLWIIIGIITLVLPLTSLSLIMFFIAFWAVVIGVFQIFMSIKIRKEIKNEWFGILNGVFTFIFGLLVLFNPFEGAEAIVMVFGFFAILSGVTSISLSFRLKSHKE